MARGNKAFIMGIILSLLLIAAGFAVFGLVKLGANALLTSIGIQAEALQYVLIIVIVLAVLILSGLPFKKALKKLLN
jgi:hypothetical protein